MQERFVKKKNQTFKVGRSIDVMKCSSCGKCFRTGCKDFLMCSNYAVEMVYEKLTPKEFYVRKKECGEGEDMCIPIPQKQPIFKNEEALEEFISSCMTIPKGVYWNSVYPAWDKERKKILRVDFVRPARKDERDYHGDFVSEMSVYLDTLSTHQRAWHTAARYVKLGIQLKERLEKLVETMKEDKQHDNV